MPKLIISAGSHCLSAVVQARTVSVVPVSGAVLEHPSPGRRRADDRDRRRRLSPARADERQRSQALGLDRDVQTRRTGPERNRPTSPWALHAARDDLAGAAHQSPPGRIHRSLDAVVGRMMCRPSRVFTACRRGCVLIPAWVVLVLLAAPALPAAAATARTAPPRYAVTVLSSLDAPFNLANAAGINDLGWIVGDANEPDSTTLANATEHATLWRHGQITDLGSLGGPNSSIGFVARPNDTGLISGNAQINQVDPNGENWGVNFSCDAFGDPCAGFQYEFRGFVWNDGVTRPLPTLGGNNEAAFGGANDEGQIVGTSETREPDPNCQTSQFNDEIPLNQELDWKPVVWGPSYGEVHELPTWPGDTVGLASAINDEGQVVGGSGPVCTPPAVGPLEHALLWENGRTINLGNLGGTYDNLATAINDRGQVVGWSDTPGDTVTDSFLWQDGVMTDLGTLPGDVSTFAYTFAYGINDAGQVVGQTCCDQSGNSQAFLWQNGTMTDLNTIADLNTPGGPVYLFQAEGINSQGEIVGEAVDQAGEEVAFSAVRRDGLPASATAHDATALAGPPAVGSPTGAAAAHSRMGLGRLAGLL